MFLIEGTTIYVTRGDAALLPISCKNSDGEAYTFKQGQTLTLRVFKKRRCANVVLTKEITITADTDRVEIYLSSADTKIGDIINSPIEYWYEVELNGGTVASQTVIGYDKNGPKVFKLYPEGFDGNEELDEAEKPIINSELLIGYVLDPDVIHGKSAYEIALLHGFEGSEEEWLAAIGDEASTAAINSLGERVASTITGIVVGSYVSMDDVSPLERKIPVKVASKNVIPFPYYHKDTAYYGGISITPNSDGSLSLYGIESEWGTYLLGASEDEPLIEAGTYTFSVGTPVSSFSLWLKNKEDIDDSIPWTVFRINDTTASATIEVKKPIHQIRFEIQGNRTWGGGVTIYPQLERGTVATPYAPYIADNTEVTVKSCGKNFVNIADKTVSGNAAWRSETLGTYDLPNGTYTLSAYIEKNDAAVPCLSVRKKAGGYLKDGTKITDGRIAEPFTVDDSCGGGIVIHAYSNNSGNAAETTCTFSNIQIELGTTATAYEPYIEGETVSTTLAEDAELTSIAPNMTITTDNASAVVEASYNKDTNIVIEKLTQAIISLGGNI